MSKKSRAVKSKSPVTATLTVHIRLDETDSDAVSAFQARLHKAVNGLACQSQVLVKSVAVQCSTRSVKPNPARVLSELELPQVGRILTPAEIEQLRKHQLRAQRDRDLRELNAKLRAERKKR